MGTSLECRTETDNKRSPMGPPALWLGPHLGMRRRIWGLRYMPFEYIFGEMTSKIILTLSIPTGSIQVSCLLC